MDEGGKAEKRRLERAGEESEKRGRASSRQNEFIKTATRLRLTSKETSFRGIVSRFPSLALRPSTIMRIHTRAVYTINLVSSLERYDPTFPKEARESDATELPRFYVRITITFRNLPKVLSSIRPAIV